MNIIRIVKNNLYYILHPIGYFQSHRFLGHLSHVVHKIVPFTWLDDKLWLEYYYFRKLGDRLNLKDPINFNEKMQWMKLYDRNPLYTRLADKYACRDYVKEKLGERYLKPLLGVFDNPDDINWTDLPNKFVVKVTHGSGWNIICTNKEKFDVEDTKKTLQKWLEKNYYQKKREWHYRNIKPKILVEQYLDGKDDYGLIEYRFYCFNGTIEFIQVNIDFNRNRRGLYLNKTWERIPWKYSNYPYPKNEAIIPKPINLEEIMTDVEKLAMGLPFMRIDLHIFDDQVFISEMTLMPGAGYKKFDPLEYNFIIGNLITLNRY